MPIIIRSFCFNPLPEQTPGETAGLPLLTTLPTRFNPLPEQTPGETALNGATSAELKFQSTPGADSGRDPRNWARMLEKTCFNPLPEQTPGETLRILDSLPYLMVSIHSRSRLRERRSIAIDSGRG